jgi:anti-anti-sigma factor
MAVVRTVTADPGTWYQLEVVDHGPLRTTIRAVGELDLAARDELAEALRPQQGGRRRIVNLDLTKVSFLDCSCLGVLVASHQRLLRQQGLLVLTGVDDAIARIFRITGLDNLLFILPAGQGPSGDVPPARRTPHAALPRQRSPVQASADSSTPGADPIEPANLVALRRRSGPPDASARRTGSRDWRPASG